MIKNQAKIKSTVYTNVIAVTTDTVLKHQKNKNKKKLQFMESSQKVVSVQGSIPLKKCTKRCCTTTCTLKYLDLKEKLKSNVKA